jgi:hypothetical protein
MLRMITMAIACFALAVVGVVTLDGRAAGADWDEEAPVGKTLGQEDPSLGDQFESSMREVRGTVPGLERPYFDVRGPASQGYRVEVASFEFVETSGGG